MNKLKIIFGVFAILLLIVGISTVLAASGNNGSLPFYENGSNELRSVGLSGGPTFGRADKDLVNPFFGDYRYPTIYEGRIGGSSYSPLNTRFNTLRGSTLAYQSQPYYHLVPLPGKSSARNVIEVSKVTGKTIKDVYGGNPDFVLGYMPTHTITNSTATKRYGEYFYIGDIAKWTGGYADNASASDSFDGVNPTWLRFVKTSWPDITTFAANETVAKVNEPLTFKISGFEYVSYNRTMVNYSLTIKKDGVTIKTIEKSTRSNKSNKNPKKAQEAEAGQFNVSSIPGFTPTEKAKYTIELRVSDEVERYATKLLTIDVNGLPIPEPEPEPEPEPNNPPVAGVFTEPFFYWPETVNFSTTAVDPDGDDVTEQLYVDGTPSGKSWNSARVTEKTPHHVLLVVTDDKGASAEAATNFDILPTAPKAETDLSGTLKVNRAVALDAKASDRVSPVHVAPIEYGLTEWTVKPVTPGLTGADIKIRPNSDKSIHQVLFKRAGTYEVLLTVTNIFGETSEIHRRELVVTPDDPPIADFTVDKATYLRNAADSKQTAINLTDYSRSVDGDIIDQRIWYVEFDANNDGLFGTPADGGKQVIDSANKTSITYKANHVGHYRFSLEVKEKFGQATYEEFILPAEYLRDVSDVIDSGGRVSEYILPDNFNEAEHEIGITVDNVPPIIDFGVKRKNKLELILDFGGMDQATPQHQTGSRPGGGVNNGGGGGSFNHHYYTYNTQDKNALTAYAGSLEADLRMKGLDVKVIVSNNYFKVLDQDGNCVQNIPVWGWVDYGSYSYSSYSGTSPYSGSWQVVSSSSTPVYTTSNKSTSTSVKYDGKTSCPHPGSGWSIADTTVSGGTMTCVWSKSESVYSHTNYSASIRTWVSDFRFVITNYTSEGCSFTEQVDTTDFVSEFANRKYSNADYKYYYRMDRNRWTWVNNASKRNQMFNKINLDDIYLWNNSTNLLRLDAQMLNLMSGKEGRYTQYNTTHLQSNIQQVRDYLLNRFMIEEDPENFTIVLGDKLDYTTVYEDFEKDPELQREWKFVHDPTSVNGRVIDGQPSTPIAQSGLYINSPMQLNEVGTYNVTLRAKDNPLSDVGNDGRFAEYQKWSDEEIVREYKINVHRRPIADFIPTIQAGTLKLTLDPSPSYDPEHQFNWSSLGIAEKGIVEYTWEKYVLDGVEYSGNPPATLQPFKDYYITLRVKDIDGAYGTVTKMISTKEVNLPPLALFDSPSIVLTTTRLDNPITQFYIRDRSYDPNGDPLTDYRWTIKRQTDGVQVWNGSNPPNSFSSIGLGKGKYLLGLTVRDIPKYPPSLQSELYEREIEVIENRPPNSCFELSRTAISVAGIPCESEKTSPYVLFVEDPAVYTDKSSDPDGHKLINYSWKVEKLDAAAREENEWNTGSPPVDFNQFGGIGKYRITQIVFDDPPSPLPSLSGSYTRIFDVVRGPQAPYAVFDYKPLLPIAGDTIDLIDQSYDEDGNVVQWQWTIKAPNGSTSVQTVKNPKITNAQKGIYTVSLHVWDDTTPTKLRSKNPAVKNITVAEKVYTPPQALFYWEPFKPFLGENFTLNPDSSFDLDGTITSYQWQIRTKEGALTTSNQRYPVVLASSEYYDVTLTVRDNDNLSSQPLTQRVNVNIAKLTPLVTHTPQWKNYWTEQGEEPDTRLFLAGEQFVIRLKTTPANRVEGEVDFGGKVGKVLIQSPQFKLIRTTAFEYEWEATLWREDFELIEIGEYLFKFKGYHPVNNPTVESDGYYIINIVDSIYNVLNYHQSF